MFVVHTCGKFVEFLNKNKIIFALISQFYIPVLANFSPKKSGTRTGMLKTAGISGTGRIPSMYISYLSEIVFYP